MFAMFPTLSASVEPMQFFDQKTKNRLLCYLSSNDDICLSILFASISVNDISASIAFFAEYWYRVRISDLEQLSNSFHDAE